MTFQFLKFQTGEEIVYQGQRGYVVYAFAVPSKPDIFRPITIKLKSMRDTIVVSATELEKVNHG